MWGKAMTFKRRGESAVSPYDPRGCTFFADSMDARRVQTRRCPEGQFDEELEVYWEIGGERVVAVEDNPVGFRVGEKDLVSVFRASAGWGSLPLASLAPRGPPPRFNSRLTI